MAQHNALGKEGETAAIEYLRANGYQIRHVNWYKGHLELDIVAQTADELIIIEVKTRSGNCWESPADAVNNTKIRRIVSAADYYIKNYDIDLPARFDIISLIGKYPDFEIEHIENAFYPPVNTYRR
jgi:putative endonuclease